MKHLISNSKVNLCFGWSRTFLFVGVRIERYRVLETYLGNALHPLQALFMAILATTNTSPVVLYQNHVDV